MFTRTQYLNKECTHSEYYAQFVTEGMRRMVTQRITLERLQRSTRESFNDIPMIEWDGMKDMTFRMLDQKKWREIQYPEYTDPRSIGWSYCDNACLLKEAARQLVEESVDATA